MKEREREGQLHNTSFLSPALHPQIDEIETHTFVNVSFCAHHVMTTTSLFPLAPPHGEPSLVLCR